MPYFVLFENISFACITHVKMICIHEFALINE